MLHMHIGTLQYARRLLARANFLPNPNSHWIDLKTRAELFFMPYLYLSFQRRWRPSALAIPSAKGDVKYPPLLSGPVLAVAASRIAKQKLCWQSPISFPSCYDTLNPFLFHFAHVRRANHHSGSSDIRGVRS
jgi:hypothetical protein